MKLREDLLTPDDLSNDLGITRRTLERWHSQRLGPPRIKLGRRVYYRAEAVRDWMLAHEQAEPRAVGGA